MLKNSTSHIRNLYLVLPLLILPWVLVGGGTFLAYKTVQNIYSRNSDTRGTDVDMKARVDELKWTLTAIGTIAGFVAIAQGGAAFFSAQIYTRQAESALAEIHEIEEEVRKRYPLFRTIEEMRSDALIDLADDIVVTSRAEAANAEPTEIMDYDFEDILYAKMDIAKRQRLLSVESFASIDLDPGPDGDTTHPENLRRLALFYQSKFQYEQDAGAASFGDLERAEGYLRIAARKSRGEFTILNDLAAVCLQIYKLFRNKPEKTDLASRYLGEAERTLDRSLKAEPRQQRAYYNRALVFSRRKEYENACRDLEAALQQKSWQRHQPIRQATALVHYNLGCYRARLLESDASKAIITLGEATLCLESLEACWKAGGVKGSIVTKDFQQEGDFSGLYAKADQALKTRLDALRPELITNATVKSTTTYFRDRKTALRMAFQSYRRLRGKV